MYIKWRIQMGQTLLAGLLIIIVRIYLYLWFWSNSWRAACVSFLIYMRYDGRQQEDLLNHGVEIHVFDYQRYFNFGWKNFMKTVTSLSMMWFYQMAMVHEKCFPLYSRILHLFLSQIEHQSINYYISRRSIFCHLHWWVMYVFLS